MDAEQSSRVKRPLRVRCCSSSDAGVSITAQLTLGKDCHEGGPPLVTRSGCHRGASSKEARLQCCTPGLDLSRRKVDVCLLNDEGVQLDQLAVAPDVDALRTLAKRIDEVHGEPVAGVVESMTGARLVHDTLEQQGWSVEIADAQKVKGLAPLACKTDRIDSMVLAVLSQRDLVPAIWLPDPRVREERELARFRLHLVKHKSALKCRIHSTLINFGRPCPVTDLFGAEGRRLLARLDVPEPWRGNVSAALALIDDLERQIHDVNRRLKAGHADHPYIPLLMSGG
jgi:transposase